MDWERFSTPSNALVLLDRVWNDLCPDIEKENITWIRSPGGTTSEVSILDDYAFPHPVASVNQYVFSASSIRNMMTIQTFKTTPEETIDRVAAFLATKPDSEGNPVGKAETTLQKVVRLFRPYLVVTSQVEKTYASAVGFNGKAVSGLFAGSNLAQFSFHPAAIVQTELRLPVAHLSCMPECHGADCGIFTVLDTDYSPQARDTRCNPYGIILVRYVVAPTCQEHVVHLYEKEQRLQGGLKSETHCYSYEVAMRRIAVIPRFDECSLVRIDTDTFGIHEYQVDFSPTWYHRRYMVSLDENE